ncbi:MAG: tyrosine-type recombinase/integrase [Lachnospiraceae bacterium]
MREKVIANILDSMSAILNSEQIEQLGNVLVHTLYNLKIEYENHSLVPVGIEGNEAKIRLFIGSKSTTGRKVNTLKQYNAEIRNMLCFLDKNIEDITAMDLRYYYSFCRQERRISMSTMQTRLHYLSSFFDFLNTEGLIKENPVKKIGNIFVEKVIRKPFSVEEMEALRVNCHGLRDRALMEFLYSTGVRVSEVASLCVKDIEMGKQETIVYGKRSKERKVYLTDNAKFYLKRYLKDRMKEEGLSEDQLQDRPLFVSLKSPHNRLTVSGIQFMLRTLGQEAGVKNVHPHRFRRTIATELLSRGMHIEEVKELLGHEKLDTTMLYCTIKEQNVRESFRKYA